MDRNTHNQDKQLQALQEIFATDPVALCKSIPDIAPLANDKSFCNKLEEIKRDFTKITQYEFQLLNENQF